MARRIKTNFMFDGGSNNSKLATKQSKGANTNNFTQSTTDRKPTFKSKGNAHSSLKPIASSTSCDGSNFMSLASSETLPQNSAYTIICAWTNGDYTNDTWLVSSSSNDAHWGIKAGGGDVIYKANGSKGAAAERDYPTDSTANSTTSHTFGSDVEMLAIVIDGTGVPTVANLYNIDGNKIADAVAVNTNGLTVSFPVDYIIGKSDGTLGLNGELLDIAIYNEALSVDIITGHGNKYKQFKD